MVGAGYWMRVVIAQQKPASSRAAATARIVRRLARCSSRCQVRCRRCWALPIVRECELHGWTTYVRIGGRRYRCSRCNVESVAARRRRIKEILVREAGGCCLICGFAKYIGALHFHHVDPASKEFSVSRDGLTRSLRRAREEAGKCVLLCANCHAMVEAGLLDLAAPADHYG